MNAEAQLLAHGPDPRLGTVIQDRYKVIRKLGEGGMGAVYEGEHVLIKRRVAIKFLHAQFATNGEVVARFHREALAATSVGNEHIVEVTDMGRLPDGSVFMVLEFLEGQSLAKLIDSQQGMPIARAVRIAMQICEALGAAHHKGIVHRDLKPENVQLIPRGGDPDFVKVLDFGIAKVLDSTDGIGLATRTNAALGTPYYMAPEQIEGAKNVDARTDLYALGVILFRALTRRHPFEAASFPMLVVEICSNPPPPRHRSEAASFPMLVVEICSNPPPSLRAMRPDVPVEFESIVNRLLAKRREDRFADCASLRAALAPFAVPRDLSGGVISAPPISTPAPSVASHTAPYVDGTGMQTGAVPASTRGLTEAGLVQKRSALPMIAGGLVVAIAVGVGVYALRARDGAPSVAQVSPPPPESPQPVVPTTPLVTQAGSTPRVEPSAPVPAMIHLHVDTTPADASLTLDGVQVHNPFDADLPQSTAPHRLEARRAGYVDLLQDVSYQVSGSVQLRLNRGRGVDDRRVTSADRGAHAPPPTATNAATPANAEPQPQHTAAAPEPAHVQPAPQAQPAQPTPQPSQPIDPNAPPPPQQVRDPFGP